MLVTFTLAHLRSQTAAAIPARVVASSASSSSPCGPWACWWWPPG